MITLVYTINQARFSRTFHRDEYMSAMARARHLRESGIHVLIKRKKKR